MNLLQSEIPHNEKYESIKSLLRQFNAAIAGGAARQLYLNDGSFGSTDIDLYFQSDKDKSLLRKCLAKMAKEKRASEYARTFSYKGLDVQIIIDNCYTGIKALFNTFDFYCCMFAIRDDKLWYVNEATEDVANKTLREKHGWTKSGNPYNLPRDYRILKYVLKKGYEPGTEYLKTRFDYLIRNFLKNGKDEHIDAWLEGKYYQETTAAPIDFDDFLDAPPEPEAIVGGIPLHWNVHWDNAVQAIPINPQMMQYIQNVRVPINPYLIGIQQNYGNIEERIINNNNEANIRPRNVIPDGEQQN